MDLGSKGKTPCVGARLKALDEAVLMAVSDFSCNFFCILSSRFEQCVPDHGPWFFIKFYTLAPTYHKIRYGLLMQKVACDCCKIGLKMAILGPILYGIFAFFKHPH